MAGSGETESGDDTASKSYSVAHAWETETSLSASQSAALRIVASASAMRPLPAHIQTEESSRRPEGSGKIDACTGNGYGGEDSNGQMEGTSGAGKEEVEEGPFEDAAKLYRWFQELETEMSADADEKYRSYSVHLSGTVEDCENAMRCIEEAIRRIEALEETHKRIESSAASLRSRCEHLTKKKGSLEERADGIKAALKKFEDADVIAKEIHSGKISPKSGGGAQRKFMNLLKRIDEGIQFTSSNPQYKESSAYRARFEELQARALSMARSHFDRALKKASASARAEITSAAPSSSTSSNARPTQAQGAQAHSSQHKGEGAIDEAARVSAVFRASMPDMSELVGSIGGKAEESEQYWSLLESMYSSYCESRVNLLRPIAQEHIHNINRRNASSISSLMQEGSEYLAELCDMEHVTFESCFPFGADYTALAPLIDPLCTLLYDAYRPRLVAVESVEDLAEISKSLKEGALAKHIEKEEGAIDAIRPFALRSIGDAQERLAFKAYSRINDRVTFHRFTPNEINGMQADGHGSSAHQLSPVKDTLEILRLLQRGGVDNEVLAGLASEAAIPCADSIESACKMAHKAHGHEKAELMATRQLVVLAEGMGNVGVQLERMERSIDLASMQKEVQRLIMGSGSNQHAFQNTSGDNDAAANARAGGNGNEKEGKGILSSVKVKEASVDPIKMVRQRMEIHCERAVESATKRATRPLSAFMAKAHSVEQQRRRGATSTEAKGGDGSISKHAFASPEALAEAMSSMRHALDTDVADFVHLTRAYLKDGLAEMVLSPLHSRVLDFVKQARSVVLDGGYSSSQIESIGLLSDAELSNKLPTK